LTRLVIHLITALKKLDEDLRRFDYKMRFDLKAALEKNGHSFRQARHYLHWQERRMQDK
jgi:hypothetical protein